MKFLSKILKFILILLLLLVVLAAATALSWYKGWPLFTGAAAMLAVAALIIAARGAIALWRWRDKHAFVSKMLREQKKSEPKTSDSAVAAAWRQGMACVLRSPSRFANTLRNSQPWFIAIEDEAGESSLFDAFGRKVPEAKSPLYWHFTESCVVLRLSLGSDESGVWESELEELLSARRRSAPLRGIVLTLHLPELLAMTDAEAASCGARLRARAQQIMLTANALFPLYILVDSIETLPGMSALIARYLPHEREGVLGGWTDDPAIGAAASEAAAEKLESLVLSGAAEGSFPHGETLSAILAIKSLAPKLDVLADFLSRKLAHQVNPQIAGIYFCATGGAGRDGGRPAFASDFISRVLPASPLPRLFGGIQVSAGGKAALMSGWLLLTLSFCGLLAANTIYQYRILTENPHLSAESDGADIVLDPSRGELAASYSRLYSEMSQIKKMEAGHKSWYLPKMGEDMLGRSLSEAKRRYVTDTNRIIIRPMIDQFRTILSTPATNGTRERDMDLARELTWFTSVLSDRLAHTPDAEAEGTFPLTSLNEAEWTPVTGRLIVNALNWIESDEHIEALASEVRSLLVQSVTRRGSNLLNDLAAQLNASHDADGVRLSQLWTHIPINGAADLQIDYCYTAAGRRAVHETVDDIEEIAGGSEILSQQIDKFRSDYFIAYAQAWENFAAAFVAAGPSLRSANFEHYTAYEKISKLADLPHIRAYRLLAANTAPLHESRVHPAWVDNMDVVNAVVSLALSNREEKKKDKLAGAVAAIENTPQLMNRLRSGIRSDAKASDIVKAEAEMRAFFENCQALLGTLSTPASATALCEFGYGGHTGDESGGTPAYEAARRALEQAFEIMGTDRSPARELLEGILDFIAAEATIAVSDHLQKHWEDEVLNSPAVLFGRGGGEALYGETGVVPQFVQKNLTNLLSYRGGLPVPAEWNGTPFPFDEEFLAALVQGSAAATHPLPPERKESFRVNISTRPPLVNSSAKQRPTMTTLTLEGDDGPQQIVNQNFPKDSVFTYSPGKSGRVTLVVSFPDFELRREYDGFKDFVTDFRMGEKTFFPMDFQGMSEQMSAADVKTVKIPIVVTNTAGIFDDPKDDAPKYPGLPTNITSVVIHR